MTSPLQLTGLVLVALVVSHLSVGLYGLVQRVRGARRQQDLATRLLDQRIRAANAARVEREQQQQHWNGYRKFVVLNKVCEADDICSVYLAPHDGKPLPRFDAGQYLTFRFNVPGRDKPVVRCYSLSDAPHTDLYRITVKRVPPPRDQPDAPAGVVSTYINESLEPGEILDVQAPRGHFTLDLWDERPAVLIGGGIGITPMLSMVNAAVDAGSTRELWLLYGVTHGRQHVMKDHLERLAAEHDNVHLQVFYSNPGSDDEAGRDYHHGGRISVDGLKKLLHTTNYSFYICGPPPMMHDLIQGLAAWGVARSDLHTEAFGANTVGKAFPEPAPATAEQEPPAATGESVQVCVRFDRAGKDFVWKQEGTLLDFAEQNGVSIDSGCRAGGCGTCLVALKSGRVRYLTEPEAVPEDNACLTCIAVPDGNIILDA